MIRKMKRERGQALILVLILLAVGAVLIVPLLQLTSSTLKSSMMYRQFANEDYAADAATEYGLWKLNWEPGYAATLPIGEESDPFCITLNGVTAWTTITAQATPGDELAGQDLMKDKISYQVVKGVSPETAEVGVETEFTYTVNLRCYDPDASLPDTFLEEINDTLARGLEYMDGSTSWDEEEWGIAPFEPDDKWKGKSHEQYWELKWKFKDRLPFTDGVEFDYGETKSMSFRVRTDGDGLEEGVYGNDITVKPGEKNLGAYQAPIIVGDPDYIGIPGGFLDIRKEVDKLIIYPNEPTTVTYTVTLTNVDIVPVRIESIDDWLPSSGIDDPDKAFVYKDNSTTANITHGPPFWSYRMKLTFDNTASGEVLEDFPVLVHLTSAHSNFWEHVNSSITTDNARDLRFVDANGFTQPYFEAEKIDYAAQDALIWVRVPSIDAGSSTDFIHLYYGNDAAGESDYHSASGVWNSQYQGVWHLKESLTGDSGEVKDSAGFNDGTGNPTDGTYTGPSGGATGQIDDAIDFDGSDDYVDLGDIIKSPSAITVATWYEIDAPPGAHAAMVNKGDTSYALRIDDNNKIEFFIYDTGWQSVFSNDVSPTETFVYAVGTWDGTNIALYIDGTLQSGSNTASEIKSTAYALQLGANSEEPGRNFEGILDEVRISSIARSADWVKAQHLSMTDAFIAYGSEQQNDDSYYYIEVPMPDTYPDAKNILSEKWKGALDELRWELKWNLENHEEARFDPIFLEPGQVMTMIFQAEVTLEASGFYFNEFYLKDVIRYPFEVEMVMDPDPPIPPYNVHHTVTMENIDAVYVEVEKIKARLPSTDNKKENEAFIYVADSTIAKINGVPIPDDEIELTKSEWEGKKRRWKVEWDLKPDIILQPGEVLTLEFDTTVVSNNPWLTFNELLWEAKLVTAIEDKVTLYSFPTAGTMVPMYDLEVQTTLGSILATNAWLGHGHEIHPKSQHWKKHK